MGMAAKVSNFASIGLNAIGGLLGAIGNNLDDPVAPETIDLFIANKTILETLSMFVKLGPCDWCERTSLGQMTKGGLLAQLKVLSLAIHARKGDIEAELALKPDDELVAYGTSLASTLGKHLQYMLALIDIGNVQDDITVADRDQLQVEIDAQGNQIEVTRYLAKLLEPVDPFVLEGRTHEREVSIRKVNFGRIGTSVAGSAYFTCTFALSNQTVERMGLGSTDYFNTGASVPWNSTDFSTPTTTVSAGFVNDNSLEQIFYNQLNSARDSVETVSLQFSGRNGKRKPFNTLASVANGGSPPDENTIDAIEGYLQVRAADGSISRTSMPTVLFEARPSDPTESEWSIEAALSDMVCASATKLFSFPSGQFTQAINPQDLEAIAIVFAAPVGYASGGLRNVRLLSVIPFSYRFVDSQHCGQPTAGTNGALAGGIGCDQIDGNIGVMTWKGDFQVAADLDVDETLVVVPILNPTNKMTSEHSNMLWGQRGPYAPAHSWPSRARLAQYPDNFWSDAPDAHALFRFGEQSKLIYPVNTGAGNQWVSVPRKFVIASNDVPRAATGIDKRSGVYVTWSFGTLTDYIRALQPPRAVWEGFLKGLERVAGVDVQMSSLEVAMLDASETLEVGNELKNKEEFIQFLLESARITQRVCADPAAK